MDGQLTANGNSAGGFDIVPGAGSGGSIYVRVGRLAGSGSILADGGNGSGSGGGGRIALYYTTNMFAGTISAAGGSARNRGGAGTIFAKSASQALGELLVDNGGNAGGTTPLVDGSYTFDRVLVQNNGVLDLSAADVLSATDVVVQANGRLVDRGNVEANLVRLESGGTLELNVADTITSMVIASGGVLTHAPGQAGFNLTVTGDLTIEPGGAITADGKGYGSDSGPGAGGSGYWEGGGGSYGGLGGYGRAASGGGVYGSITEPLDLGSGGGSGGRSRGWSGSLDGRRRAVGGRPVNGQWKQCGRV